MPGVIRPINLDNYLNKTWARQKKVNDQLKFAILAAGLGKRMDPLTQNHLPKPMFPLGGSVPMLELWVRTAVEAGITDISMNLCVLKDTIKSYFEDGTIFGAKIDYIEEDTPSGTLGGICKQALGEKAKVFGNESKPQFEKFKGTTIIAPSGDIVTNFGAAALEQMYEIHQQKGSAFTMLLSPIAPERRGEFGTVELKSPEKLPGPISEVGRVVEFLEKDPNSPSILNNASLYMIDMDLLEVADKLRTEVNGNDPEPFYDFGKHLFQAMLGKLAYKPLATDYPLFGIRYDDLWFDVGRKRDYLHVNKALLDGKIRIDLPYQKLPWGYLGSEVVIDYAKVTIIPPVIIGHNCEIGSGVTLGPYAVIGNDWRIEDDAEIRNSVLWERYAYHTNGEVIPVVDRKVVDRHIVRQGTIIDECIIVGGTIDSFLYAPGEPKLHEKTIDITENGELEPVSIDWVPTGPRP